MAKARKRRSFNVKTFLSTVEDGRTSATCQKNQKVFSQGGTRRFRLLHPGGQGQRLRHIRGGKEAVVALHGNADFFGEGCLTGQPLRLATVVAVTECG